MRVVDLLKEQELIKAKYFTETEEGFIIEVSEVDDTDILSEQICDHYEEVSKALKRYMELEDTINKVYANTIIQVLGHSFSALTGLKLLKEIEQVIRDPLTGKLVIKTHPMGVFLSMCSAPCKYSYSNKPRKYLDPLNLLEDTVIEDVLYKIEEFLIQLQYEIEKVNNEIEV